jgi:hypothetical protein
METSQVTLVLKLRNKESRKQEGFAASSKGCKVFFYCLIKHYTMKACEVGGITPHIRNLDVSMQIQCLAISFARHTSNENLGRPLRTLGRREEIACSCWK